jgi:hypothetical protein
VTASGGERGKRSDLPRRLGDILTPALGRIVGSEEARAYAAWSRAVGEPVTRGTRPKAFRRGQLTVECASSVWANELTYLGPQILRRMDEVAPGHPVERFRFVVGRLHAPDSAEDDPPPASRTTPEAPGEESGSATEKKKRRHEQPAPDVADAARTQAEGVQDGPLRAAIEAALRRSAEEPPEAPARGTPSG